MSEIRGLFWDLGGVLLTNGWDRAARWRAVEIFGLDREEFDSRHAEVDTPFELGRLGLDEYLDRVVFYQSRRFERASFKEFMFAQSQAHPDALAIVDRLAASGRHLLATLNNESLELNEFRIARFGLRRYFTAFFSSCFVGVKKPEAGIYRVALQVAQLAPEEVVLIDDRLLNLECASHLGIRTIHYREPVQLVAALREQGIDV